MNKIKQLDQFIQILHDTLKEKSNLIEDDVKIRFKIKDRLWSAVFLLEFDDLSITVSKDGVTSIYPLKPEKDEPKDLMTLKDFLKHQLINNNITFEELERFIFEAL